MATASENPIPVPLRVPPWAVLAVYWLGLAAITHWPKLDVTGGRNEAAGGLLQIDKVGHVFTFSGLTLLLLAALSSGRRVADRRSAAGVAIVGLAVAAFYALVDEYTQRWFQRELSWGDLMASLIGVSAAVVLWWHPRRAEPNGWSRRRVRLARLTLALLAPALGLLAVLPGHARVLGPLIQVITDVSLRIDHLLHLVLAVGLTWLLAAASPAGTHRPRLSAAVTILAATASAPLLEGVQWFTGRGVEVSDVRAHMDGVLIALAVWAIAAPLASLVRRPGRGDDVPDDAATSPATAGSGGAARAAAAEQTQAPGGGRGFIGAAMTVGAMTFLSRITGLLRDAVLAAAFGLSGVSDAFNFGFLVPNLFRRLFGEGALSAAFIPHYSELLKRDKELAARFATLCLTLLTVVLVGLTLIGEGVLMVLATSWDWTADTSLAIRLMMIMLPYMPLVCLVAIVGGVLQVHGRFATPAAVPIMLNLVMVAAGLWATWGVPMTDNRPAQVTTAYVLAWSVLVAGVVQMGTQAWALLRVTPIVPRFEGTGESLRSMLAMMVPMLVGLSVFQLNTLMDMTIAFFLSVRPDGATGFELLGRFVAFPMRAGDVAAIGAAQRLYQFPLGVFGIAVATAIFPLLASAAPAHVDGTDDRFAEILRRGLRLTVFIGLPASVGLILLSLPLTRVAFERGAFTTIDSISVAIIVAVYSGSVWAYSMTHVLTRGFYALKDSKTPLRISMAMIGINFLLNITLVWPLGIVGLATSSATTAIGQVLLLLIDIRRRVERPIDRYVLRGWAMTAGLTLLMGVVIRGLLALVDFTQTRAVETAAWLAGLVALGAGIVLGGAWLAGAEELSWLRRQRR